MRLCASRACVRVRVCVCVRLHVRLRPCVCACAYARGCVFAYCSRIGTKGEQIVDISGTLFLWVGVPEKVFRDSGGIFEGSLAFSRFVLLFVHVLFLLGRVRVRVCRLCD